jgi:serine/threonine-protein kinase
MDDEPLPRLAPPLAPRLMLGALALAAVLGVALFATRGTQPEPAHVTLRVDSRPPGARVTRLDTGERLGVTPLAARVPRAGLTGLSLALEGFMDARREASLLADVAVSVDLLPLEAADDAAAEKPVRAAHASKRSAKAGRR